MGINVLLVDDHTIIREGLASILQAEGDIQIIAEAGSGQEALEKLKQCQPDIVVMDLTLPDMGGVQVTRHILAAYPTIKVLVLTMYLDDTCVFESLEAGVRGYLVKDCAAEELVVALRTIQQGRPYFCTGAQEIMMKKCQVETVEGHRVLPLTKRETEVLTLTARGLTTKEIAFELQVSIKMIEVHRSNLKKKLGINSIAQLATYAMKNGLIAPP